MNKFYQWFYDKTKKKMEKEVELYGLHIMDENKFNAHVLKASKSDMIFSILMVILIILIIIKYLGVL
jgi:hypothetical protein